jgi:hypothetical protein
MKIKSWSWLLLGLALMSSAGIVMELAFFRGYLPHASPDYSWSEFSIGIGMFFLALMLAMLGIICVTIPYRHIEKRDNYGCC